MDWETIVRPLERLVRLKSFPVAFKLLENKADLEKIPFLRRPESVRTMCQLISLVRNFDWTVGADVNDFMGAVCPSIIGLCEVPDAFMDGTFRSIVWTRTKEDGKKYEESIQRIPAGKFEALAMAPLVYNPFDPDMVLIYGNPAQMILIINALQLMKYEVMEFFCVGESSCSDAIARCYLTGKPSLTIPCYGERRYGHAQDEDLVMALTPDQVITALKGVEILYRRGIRYPISFAGAETDISSKFPGSYGSMEQLDVIRGNDNRLLVGLTGGIASGKSTVAKMLKEKGAPIIDFDAISHEVVEPGQPALQDIVDFFGKQVLAEDGTLDRKAMSDIVFNDMEKRKKLESFIHPRIQEGFIRDLMKHTSEDPNAIVQVDIPLMIELNLQYMFHKLLVVYVSPEVQIERLAKRDNITQESAANILRAQLSIDDKLGFADYVVHNEGTVEETQRQVDELWETLKKEQAAMAAKKA